MYLTPVSSTVNSKLPEPNLDLAKIPLSSLWFSKHIISDFSNIPSTASGSITSIKPPKSLDSILKTIA